MYRAAMLGFAPALGRIELIKQRRQICDDTCQLRFRAINQLVAVRAIPLEGVQRAFWARHFDDDPDRLRWPLRRMPKVLGQKKYFALFDWHFQWRLARRLHEPECDVSLQLVEEFFRGIVVIVAALVGPTHHGDHHLAVFPNLRISDGRLELLFVFFYPALKVESFQILDRRHLASYSSGL